MWPFADTLLPPPDIYLCTHVWATVTAWAAAPAPDYPGSDGGGGAGGVSSGLVGPPRPYRPPSSAEDRVGREVMSREDERMRTWIQVRSLEWLSREDELAGWRGGGGRGLGRGGVGRGHI